jgi:CHASE3 domain sensor protein
MSAAMGLSTASVVQRFDVFLSHNSRDRAVVERIAQRLKQAGVEPWLDKWSLTPGGEWQRELGHGLDASLACAVFVGPHDLGAWELQELAVVLDRAARQRSFRLFPVLLPGVAEPFDPNHLPHFLRARTWVDFRRGGDDERALQDLIHAVKGVPFGPDVPVAFDDGAVPYRGLRAFREEDAPFFFGRDREIQRLVEKLKSTRFVAVLGTSGSGKSSLVRAGLVCKLRAGALGDDEHWDFCVLRPGAAPLTALAAQLAKRMPGQPMRPTLDALAQDARTLHLSVELTLADGGAGDRVVVIVDQLEEVFTLCRDETERRQFLSTLVDATSAPGGRTVVIVTLRTDFYAHCATYPEFAQLVASQQMLVGPIDAEGLLQAIEEPAHHVGLELEQGLSETILTDVGAEPGALPLLEHALLELWERRRGSMLTLEGYTQAGGVNRALGQRAEEIHNQLSRDQQQIARRVLLRLTQPGQGTDDTRRRAPRSELLPAEGDDDVERVLRRLVDARLLTSGRDETGKEVVDVSHEALIRGWPRLREWIDADRAGLLTHRRLTDAAHDWDALNREPAALYRGARLAAAREWAVDHDEDLSRLESDFLAASHANEDSEAVAIWRRTRRVRGLATGLAALTVIVGLTLVLLTVAVTSQRDSARTAFRSQEALAVGSELENAVITIENGLRGYAASGEKRLLLPVEDAIRRYPGQQRALARLVSAEGAQLERVQRVSGMIDDYVGLWARSIIALSARHLARARSQLVTNDTSARPGETAPSRLDPIRAEFARLSKRERAVIAANQEAANARSARAIRFGSGGLVLVLVVVVGLVMYLRPRDPPSGWASARHHRP